MRATRAQALALVLGVVAAGCINTSAIQAGKIACDPNAAQPCPDGFTCEPGPPSLCVRLFGRDAASDPSPAGTAGTGPLPIPDASFDAALSDRGTGGSTGGAGGGAAGVGASDGGGSETGGACMPVPGCVSDGTKMCDPVCQTGCASCQEKCSANSAGTYTCNVPLPLRPKQLGEACNISSLGLPSQTDDCSPGLVCRPDACSSRCYKFCKSDADCPNSTCTVDAGGGVKVCDVPRADCNPVKVNGSTSGCSGATEGCFLSSTSRDLTICDCPQGAGGPNSACTISRDCFPGLACVAIGGVGNSICRQVCSLANGNADCSMATCHPLNGSAKYGYCN
jgi:hypothetical protein